MDAEPGVLWAGGLHDKRESLTVPIGQLGKGTKEIDALLTKKGRSYPSSSASTILSPLLYKMGKGVHGPMGKNQITNKWANGEETKVRRESSEEG